jgi:hypothetical protein
MADEHNLLNRSDLEHPALEKPDRLPAETMNPGCRPNGGLQR